MEQILEKLFESIPTVRLLRIFMRNPESFFTLPEIVTRSQLRKIVVRHELAKLTKLDVIKKRNQRIREEVIHKSGSSKRPPRVVVKIKKAKVYYANPLLPILQELQNLVTKATVASRPKLLRHIKGLGVMKLAVVSGVFLNNDRSRTDLLLVGDHIKKRRLENFLANIESELGKSLNYTLMDTEEFKYRTNMYDRFLRDILEYPHEKLINRFHI